jgi:uncharacterized OB-fold protein
MKMTPEGVLHNLKEYESWDHSHYSLRREEAEVIIPLLEKASKKKPINHVKCPECGRRFAYGEETSYCPDCGQRLAWNGWAEEGGKKK